MRDGSGLLNGPSRARAVAVSLSLVVAWVLLHLFSFPNYSSHFGYVLPLLIGLWHRRKRLAWFTALLCALLGIIDVLVLRLRDEAGDGSILPLLIYRTFSVLFVAAAIDAAIRVSDQLKNRTQALERSRVELHRALERLDLALTSANAALWEWDAEEAQTDWPIKIWKNCAGEQHYQEHWEKLIPKDELARLEKSLREASSLHSDLNIEFSARVEGGETRWFLVRGQPYGMANGKENSSSHYFGIVVDITSRKASEEALRNSDSRKNEFLAVLSHELRNPLAPIRNSLALLERVDPGSKHASHARAVIGRQVGHLTRLVDDLLDVVRISKGKIRLKTERIELAGLINRVVEDHRSMFSERGILLTIDPFSNKTWVEVDSTRIVQVVGNLLQNSAKFTPHGKTVAVSMKFFPATRQVSVSVNDEGAGIAADMLPRLFQPFAQADVTLDRSKGGLGLGLALVKGLVEMHGGTVSATSKGIGKGAEFTMVLPLASETTEKKDFAPSRAADAKSSLRLLVIEDNADTAETMREVLEFEGHSVQVALNGADGVEKARAYRPDAVLCDLGLPVMNGFEVAQAIRKDPKLRAIKLIAITGYAATEDVAKSLNAGFDYHIAKPPDFEQIEEILRAPR